MAEPKNKKFPFPRVNDFYEGKSVFMTGAAGYLGVLILQSLLELCPGIKHIYILLRARKGVSPEKRKDGIFQRVLFDDVKKKTPEVLDKVQVMCGDVSLPDFGMNDEDLQTVIENASIIFHVAATVNFSKTFKYTLEHNVMSTQYAIDICRKLKKLEAFVFTSSAFSNSNRISPVQEHIYRLPFHSQRFIDEIRHGTNESLAYLYSECQPPWPNFYTFSKVLAESLIQETASDLPVIIVRPSLIGPILKRPVPGYIEDSGGLTALSIGMAKGFIKVMPGDPDIIIDMVPGDVSASTHIIAAWSIATKRSPPMHIIHNTSCILNTIGKYTLSYQKGVEYFGGVLPNAFRYTNRFGYIKNPLVYKVMAFYEHYVPAYCFDVVLKLRGKKYRLVPIYKMIDMAIQVSSHFMRNYWTFNTDNFQNLLKQVQIEELKSFELEETKYTCDELTEILPKGAPFFQWSGDKLSPKERRKIANHRYYMTHLFQGLFLLGVAVLLYFLFTVTSSVFQ